MHPFLQHWIPQHFLSRLAGKLANSRALFLKNALIRYFVNRYPVKLEEAEQENAYEYPSFNAFFTRRLKPGLRPIANGLYDFVSPADGSICQIGEIQENNILQAKGKFYSIQALLGGNAQLAKTFDHGLSLTVYLAPQDYHRVHMPIDGHLTQMIYVPGRLFSVNTRSSQEIHNLFARNERVVTIFNTSVGKVAIILVGAMIVGSIDTAWAGTITPRAQNRQDRSEIWQYENPIFLKRGEELGQFKLGSTVIVLLEKQSLTWNLGLESGSPVKMGECLGLLKPDRF